jgi:hypothetical protein
MGEGDTSVAVHGRKAMAHGLAEQEKQNVWRQAGETQMETSCDAVQAHLGIINCHLPWLTE